MNYSGPLLHLHYLLKVIGQQGGANHMTVLQVDIERVVNPHTF